MGILSAAHRGLTSRRHLGGKRFEARLVADDPPLEHRVIGAASLRFMDRGGDRARASGALEGLVESLDVGTQKTLGLEDVALNRHGLAMLAQVESGIDDVVMPAPCTGENRRMAGPRDAREIDDRSVREHRAALDQAGEIWNRARIVIELMAQLRMRQAVEQEHVDTGWARGVIVDNFVERLAVLALEVNLGRRARGVAAGDFRESHQARDRRRDIDLARAQLEQSTAHARTAEHQRRAGLHHVERAMLPRLDSIGVGLGAEDDIGSARTVEELGDSLVRVGMAEDVGFEPGAIWIVGAIAAAGGGVEFLVDSGDDEWVLICDRVAADLLDDFE